MKSLTDSFVLNNGVEIPCIGFGTWQTPDGDLAVSSVLEAIAAGYRHIDTAAAYGNEASVGRAVKQSGVPRKELFITSKLQNPMHGYENTRAAFEATMQKLDTDYLDLYLIHWPNPVKFRDNWEEANAGTWKAFEEYYKAGRIRALGVSNFHPRHIDALLKTATVVPQVNQIRLCPGDTQDEVVAYCRARQILPEAYSPLGTGKIFDVPALQELSKKYNKTIAQICIRWSLQMEFLPLPKSVTPERIRENAQVFDFELSAGDVKAVADLKGVVGYSQDPDATSF
ncbi:MAG: aldo/keto reductase [Treponema sp.]|jgi:diketogulonate reductase-like aldo/keto reductase|nr:aldo/keto reductase [Treponema sp.]